MTIQPLQTERLSLRGPQEDDVEGIMEYCQSEDVKKYIPGIPHPYTEEHARKHIEKTKKKNEAYHYEWIITHNQEPIGSCSIHTVDPTSEHAEISYILGKQHWGNGYMTEALRNVMKYGFDELNLNKIMAITAMENKESVEMLKTLGFTKEGDLREHIKIKDTYYDAYLYTFLKAEWEAKEHL